MKLPYSEMTIERLERTIVNHEKALKAHKRLFKKIKEPLPIEKRRMYMAEWKLKAAKHWLQKKTDARDMKNH